jgi:hypothetical protein
VLPQAIGEDPDSGFHAPSANSSRRYLSSSSTVASGSGYVQARFLLPLAHGTGMRLTDRGCRWRITGGQLPGADVCHGQARGLKHTQNRYRGPPRATRHDRVPHKRDRARVVPGLERTTGTVTGRPSHSATHASKPASLPSALIAPRLPSSPRASAISLRKPFPDACQRVLRGVLRAWRLAFRPDPHSA